MQKPTRTFSKDNPDPTGRILFDITSMAGYTSTERSNVNIDSPQPLPKDVTPTRALSFSLPQSLSAVGAGTEVTVEEVHSGNDRAAPQLATDEMDALERRVLIAYFAYGPYAHGRTAAFVGADQRTVREILAKPHIQAIIQNGGSAAIPCWTPGELVARLSVEAETAQRPQDRIAALKLLMEYRSLSQPEGGSRSFKRIAAKFTTGGAA